MTTDTLTSRRRGGQPNNTNAARHGLRGSGLPKGCSYLEGQLTAFKRFIRNELAHIHGEVSFIQEAILQSACRHETRCLLVSRWLRIEHDSLTVSERAVLLRDLSNATDLRDRCLDKLKLESNTQDILTALYADSPVDSRSASDATDEPPEAADALERKFRDESETQGTES